MSASTVQQVKALMRRYCIGAYRYPIGTLIRVIVWPGALLGIYLQLAIHLMDDSSKLSPVAKQAVVSTAPTLLICLIPIVQIYHYSKRIVSDRESGQKSLMLSMGVSRISLYLSHSFCFITPLLPAILFLAHLLISKVFDDSQSSPLALWTVFILFAVHLTGFVFAITTLINSVKYVIYFLAILLYENGLNFLVMWIAVNFPQWDLSTLLFFACLSPFESLRLLSSSYKLCKNCEETNLDKGEMSYPTRSIITAMLFWTLVEFAFARWFEEVCPWQKDSAVKSPIFFCQSNKSQYSTRDYSIELIDGFDTTVAESKYFERVLHGGRKVGISVSKLKKLYKLVPVVNDVTFDIYEGETTLLLGHNGAGKTTLMDIILGRLSHDAGHVTINRGSSGSSIGVCPQTSVLDENLTVRQHLELFYDLKTSRADDLQRAQHIDKVIDDVQLSEHAHKLPSQLSGGMQRKLNLAMAFVGDSKVLILDEPSSGLDPESRVSTWKAIKQYRADRTVLLSTQHMEEADYLGDRVAIMSSGRIICCGSSIFLNNVFGNGYRLRVECVTGEAGRVLELVRRHFSGAYSPEERTDLSQLAVITEDSFQDLAIELNCDYSDEYESKLINLLENLEAELEHSMFIKSFGLKSYSMDDVLLRSMEISVTGDETTRISLKPSNANIAIFTQENCLQDSELSYLEQTKLFLRALLIKNVHIWKNDYLIIGVILVFATLSCRFRVLNMKESYNIAYGVIGIPMVIHLVHYPTLENVTKFKIIQLRSKMNFVIYWLGQLLSDLVFILLLVIEINLFLLTSYNGVFVGSPFNVHIIASIALLLSGISAALLAYIFSTTLKSAKSSVFYYMLFFLIGPVTIGIITLVRKWRSVSDESIEILIDHLFALVVPLGALEYVLGGLGSECYTKRTESSVCPPVKGAISPITYGFLTLLIQIILYATVLYYIEREKIDIISYLRAKFKSAAMNTCNGAEKFDEDVLEEKRKVLRMIENSADTQTSHSLLAVDISKSYATVKAVDHLSFGVKRGECLGLLGVNGAGKTTAFSMISEEILPDSGRIWVKPDEIFGYDPQLNPDMLLTAEQALCLMARLRCVPEQTVPSLVGSLLALVELTEHSNKMAKILSGGSKRKLFLAMSLIGNTPLLALDEPTAGVDPISRRNIWLLLRSLQKYNQTSIVISSHVMEECEAICDRVAIMARGRLHCLGTLLHLRSKFPQECTIKIQFTGSIGDKKSGSAKDDIVSQIKSKISEDLGVASPEIVDTNFNSATLRLSKYIKRSILFKILRQFQRQYPQVRYQVNDSSFEDIFIAVSREQI